MNSLFLPATHNFFMYFSRSMMLAEIVLNIFTDRFAAPALVFRSPGRINLIGEHTDYNEGFVLPAAIDKAIYLAIAPAESDTGTWISVDFGETIEVSRWHDGKLPQAWANYIQGIIHEFGSGGHKLPAFNLVVAADIPIGAGLSSSAALECVVAYALNHFLRTNLDRKSLAFLTKKAENEFIGLQCGIMDMFASLHGKKDHVLRLDCRTLEYDYFPLELNEYVLLLLDTGVKHSLASSEYNTRREECAAGVSQIRKNFPSVSNLRDVDLNMLEKSAELLDDIVYRRCKFVVEENQRVWLTCGALVKKDYDAVGELMFASHEGLQHHYQVSCGELDFLVDAVRNDPAVAGARMMGGGFGGCTINLVLKEEVPALVNRLASAYQDFSGNALRYYEVVTGDGTNAIKIQSLV